MTGQQWRARRLGGWEAGRHLAAAISALILAAVVIPLGTFPAAAAARAHTSRAAAPATPAISAIDTPAGFRYGTDSRTVTVPGPAPYRMPVTGGYYGGYLGMAGNWANITSCRKTVVWSAAGSAQANTNHAAYHTGIGTGAYWFMGGPGVDPHYTGTASEAYTWGARQAKRALADIAALQVTYPVVFADIALPGNTPSYTPAPDNGWKSVYTTPCSGVVRARSIPASVDRADLNGFTTYLTSHSSYKAGVYSAPDIWAEIFGTGTAAAIPHTYEWTYEAFTGSLAHPPAKWCLTGSASAICAHFFGGISPGSKYALMWQWSGSGTSNGIGDFDQIDGRRTP
jgi:hypothetical protein